MRRTFSQSIVLSILAAVGLGLFSLHATAETTSTEEINALNDEITAREARLDQLNAKLDQYSDAIRQKEAQADSLDNEIAILENKAAKLELDIEATELEIDNVDDEVRVLDLEITSQTLAVARQKKMLASVLREMEMSDDATALEMIFSTDNFSELFDRLSRLESVNNDLKHLLNETQNARLSLENKKAAKQEKLAMLEDLQAQMITQQHLLEDSQGAKQILLAETQSSEAEYRTLAYKLRQEQSYIDSQLIGLQKEIEERISDSDLLGDSTLITWPVDDFVMTTRYHDPSYPFRKVIGGHSGLDLAAPSGTPVYAAAPGYVAFTKTGSMYGNYMMIIHGNGVATLYAHLSSFTVVADQFVSRGDQIGRVGSTGFSTGPHLHFEVRSEGIPVDPMGYLVGY